MKSLRDLIVDGFNAKFTHFEHELTPGAYPSSVAFEYNGYFHFDSLVFVYFEEVDVEDFVCYGVELNILEYSLASFTCY